MKVEQIYTGCLSHAAYYIESNGEAAVFDPLREVQPYLERAAKDNAVIKYVFETHFHADFVSGHVDLMHKTGAQIVFGPNAKPAYPATIAKDGDVFRVGQYKVKVIHTPGHTMESTTYLLIDEEDREHGIVTGDTLFIGDVGRPDLAQHLVADLTREKLAGLLYDSLRDRIMPLADSLVVYPNHGRGSACGKNMSSETTDTLGHQKKVNYALDPGLTKERFITEVLAGLVPPPAYFPQNVLMNINGSASVDDILQKAAPMTAPEFRLAAEESGALILDTRHPDVFCHGFIPGSVNIGIDGTFATWAGTLIPLSQKILLVTEEGRENEAVTRLARVGCDHVIGFLKGGFASWKLSGEEIDHIRTLNAIAVAQALTHDGGKLVDVRKVSEHDSEHVIGSMNVPLDLINEKMSALDPHALYYVHCASGYRSVVFISILQARGMRNLVNVMGGFKSLKESRLFEVSAYAAPTSLL